MKLLIPCASGLEASVKRQLKELGYGDCPAIEGRISLTGDWEDVARLNVFLRSGERVLISLGSFQATTFDELFENVRKLPFEEFLSAHTLIRMDGKSSQSKLGAIKAAGGVAKKAIVERLKQKLGIRSLDERGERAIVGVSIFRDVATVTLDTSGDGLHKRGYRVKNWEAPLKETTAAAMVESSFYRAGKPFADLFCGSGTIPIEAALYALKIAPGAKRDFDFLHWKNTPKVMDGFKKQAEELRDRTTKLELFAGDVDPKAIELARFHARRAGVEEHIRFAVADMRNFTSKESYGILMSNPPYGERMGREEDLRPLYRDFGKVFRSLDKWSCYFLSGFPEAERCFGGKADKRRKLYNANLECGLFGFFGKKPE